MRLGVGEGRVRGWARSSTRTREGFGTPPMGFGEVRVRAAAFVYPPVAAYAGRFWALLSRIRQVRCLGPIDGSGGGSFRGGAGGVGFWFLGMKVCARFGVSPARRGFARSPVLRVPLELVSFLSLAGDMLRYARLTNGWLFMVRHERHAFCDGPYG